MFDASQKPTGTEYTTTVALVAVAFVFCPAVLAVSYPFGYVSLSLAVGCSGACAALAWICWRRTSRPHIPSIAVLRRGTK